jgi:hypothetical protein
MMDMIPIICTSIIRNSKSKIFFLLSIFLFLLFPSEVLAQVVINEFSSSTASDWVELFALEETDVSGWFLDDDGTATNMATIPEGTTMGASTYYVVEVSNRLNKNGDIISLFTKDGALVDRVPYGSKGGVCVPSESGSVGRYPDANSTIERFLLPTKGASNDLAQLNPCPTPTPTPTPSPTPTSTITPTPTPTLTSIPTSTATPRPTVKAVSTIEPTPKPTNTIV